MDLVENDVDTLHEEIEYLVGHLVGNDMDTLHEERIHLVVFSFIYRLLDKLKAQKPMNKNQMAEITRYIFYAVKEVVNSL